MGMNFGLFLMFDMIRRAGGMPYIVGGTARRKFLPEPAANTDMDIEVFGLDQEALVKVLNFTCNKVDFVGKQFGVYKVTFANGMTADVSIPRTEVKRGTGHRGFDVAPSPGLTPEEAVQRRDFTMNAIMIRMDGTVVPGWADPTGGREDIKQRILRHVGPQFADDPLRVLRAMQFAARFGMTMAPETAALCEQMSVEYKSLPKERIWGEWEKWARLGQQPSRGLDVLDQTNWVLAYPDLAVLMLTPQDSTWHPEGNVWEHTKLAVDAAVVVAENNRVNDETRTVLVLAALLHDVGKPATTEVGNGRVTSHGHDKMGVEVGAKFLDSIGAPEQIKQRVLSLVGEHMWGADEKVTLTQRSIRRLAHRLDQAGNTVHDLTMLMTADNSARPPLPGGVPMRMMIAENEAAEMKLDKGGPKPILMGRHLLEMGWQPGRKMGNMLKRAFEAQLDGAFDDIDEAKFWLERQVYPV